jgi:transposase-like protein
MLSQLREQAIKLRTEKEFSYSKIRKRLGVPKSTLSYWLRGFPLSEEKIKELKKKGWKKAEVKIERFRAAMRRKRKIKEQGIYSKYQKKFKNLSKKVFFAAGLMLYLGEGDKRDYSKIALANTDPGIIKFFVQWLNEFLGIPKNKMKIGLHLYENMDIKKEKEFWKNELGFQEDQLYKPWITKLKKTSFSYRESFRHGTCSLYVLGVEKKRELMMAVQAFVDKYIKGA